MMPLQIANPEVVRKVELLSNLTGLSKTAAVEKAVDTLLSVQELPASNMEKLRKILAQIDQIPDRTDAHNPIEYDEIGVPK